MKEFIKNILYPKYIIMMGIRIENRAIMFLGVGTKVFYEYGVAELKFENLEPRYYASNIHKRIYTFKSLMKWRRMLDRKNSRCLEYKNFEWQGIKNDKPN